MEVNDHDYWSMRFSTDWMSFGGDVQTKTFARMMLGNLPMRILREMATESLQVVDYGCAQGECAAMIKNIFPNLVVRGVDFSAEAIRIANREHGECNFEVADITTASVPCDIAVCSNVLEHVKDPLSLVRRLTENASRYVILLVPFHEPENSGIVEHVQRFSLDSFDSRCGDFQLAFSKVIRPLRGCEKYWPYLQLLLVYAKGESSLGLVDAGDIAHATSQLNDIQSGFQDKVLDRLNRLEMQVGDSVSADKRRLESENTRLLADVQRLESENARLQSENRRLEAEKTRLEERVARYEQAEDAVLKYIRSFTANNSARLVNAAKHIRLQVLSGGLRGKKDFIAWFNAARKRANQPDARFNPFWDIYETTRKTFAVSRRADSTEKAGENQIADVPVKISSYGKFDVLFFSVIDYGFRYQRPQQIADYYARNGHRVFYFNVNFGIGEEVTVHQTHENLFEVTLNFKEQRNVYTFTFADVREALESQLNAVLRNYSILDAIAISEYPNWIDAVRYVKHTYAMTDVLDYLDDWDGFENTATPELVANTREILTLTDCVIASSRYLADKAALSKNVVLVRNGTEFSHFNKIFRSESDARRGRHKIGYYGAIAHWFDLGKIKALAEALPDVEIELIGAVSTDVSGVAKLPNVKFLGEKPYGDLPELIRDWEVCLIPFDTSTSLIKATNPVKFYEYLSAGKKIVATEIPEIKEFSGKYALLANDGDRFVDYVKACLEDRDGLLPAIERVRFARENDWQCRLEAIDAAVMKSIPRFSIVVLTYGQLDYTKLCLNSILKWTAYPNYELIVVDNASTDGTPAYLTELAAKYPQMRVILNEKNLGFAAGNNVGLRAATGDYLLLLNNDTMVSRGWLSRFLAHFRAHPECGAAGPVSNSIGNKAMVAVQYEDIAGFLDESRARAFDHAFAFSPEDKCLAMFCFAFPRAVMDKVGCISEEYGRGMFEDDDYCMAIKKAGLGLSILEDVLIHHFLSASFNALSTEAKQRLFESNRKVFEAKWGCEWKKHSYREGVTWNTNVATQLAFEKILGEGETVFASDKSVSQVNENLVCHTVLPFRTHH